jgi:predicted transcriptional regulator
MHRHGVFWHLHGCMWLQGPALQHASHCLMHEAIEQYVARGEKREAYRQDGIKARENHQRTGLHATAAQADDWLAQLEQGQDVEPPELHS